MKIKYLKLKNWLLISLAGVLGINVSCDQMTEEYGCPMADFNVKGKVTDADGNAIRGIKVEMDYYCDTTDANGNYSVRANSIPGDVSRFDVYFADIDGSELTALPLRLIRSLFQRSTARSFPLTI